MRIAKNTVVTLDYRVTDSDGNLVDEGPRPIVYLHGGYGGIFDKIEEALQGKAQGDQLVVRLEPEEGFGRRLHWIIHGVHHDHPNDPLRLVMPPSASIPLALLFVGLFQLLLPTDVAWALTAGVLGGYLGYDMTHYYVHHRRPKGPLGRRLRELHMRHHFQDHTRGYGVSAPWWDRVFGTAPRDRPDA